MQDPRIRFACAFLLSLGAFISLTGAALAFLWWLAFTPRGKGIRHVRAVAVTFLLFALIALVMILTRADGLSYLVRMTAILLIGTWVYADSRTGDFLSTGTWLLGTRAGFELGMIAEISLGMAQGLSADLSRVRLAAAQKGQPWGIKSILPAGRVIISDALRRADETAEVLAVRGYRCGGTLCPQFFASPRGFAALACAAAALTGAYLLH